MYLWRFMMALSVAVVMVGSAERLQAQETTPPAATTDTPVDRDDMDWGWIGLLGLLGLGGLAGRRRDVPTRTTTRTGA
jgi:MYXO-CTERM domain-containing protein